MRKLVKYCIDNEKYTFKDGVAIVPNCRRKNGKPVKITLAEFKEFNQEEMNND